MSGELKKLVIESFTDADCTQSGGESYTALINPDQIVMDTKIEYEPSEESGNNGEQQRFVGISSPKLNLKLLFDGTGILLASTKSAIAEAISSIGSPPTDSPSLGTVTEQIDAFQKVATSYYGENHEPRYVRIIWGGIIFKGRLETFKVTYTLFKPDGSPLRATGDAGFVGSVDPATQANLNNNQSPDLTHIRIVKEGDTLPLMCNRIYKNSKLYLEIAKVNKLSNYRNLKPGAKLFFPPIKNQS